MDKGREEEAGVEQAETKGVQAAVVAHRWVSQYNAALDGQTLDLVPIPELDINTVKRRLIPKVRIDTVRNHFEMCCE
jgi:hypothetical protein